MKVVEIHRRAVKVAEGLITSQKFAESQRPLQKVQKVIKDVVGQRLMQKVTESCRKLKMFTQVCKRLHEAAEGCRSSKKLQKIAESHKMLKVDERHCDILQDKRLRL